ncbi:MAG: hypothetical protein JKY31_01045 [Rhodobacteraceae bacterium]|nr:hypothetical protein [Paracoccaceae bacterium]
MKITPLIAFLAFSNAALAQNVMPIEEFESYATGTTLYFTMDGLRYGSEQFLEGRRTVWRAEDGSCVNGKWTEINGGICFLYDGRSAMHCWTLTREDGIISIQSLTETGEPGNTTLEIGSQDSVPIICTGPSVGV